VNNGPDALLRATPMTSLHHPRKLFLFTALSLADLSLTAFLLQGGGVHTYESNPIAAWWLARFGWAGLTAFKMAVTLLVASLVLVVSRCRPRTGGSVLVFACTAVLAVVLYSACLVSYVAAEVEGVRAEVAELDREFQDMEQHDAVILNRISAKERVAEEVAAGQLTLIQAADRFRQLDQQFPAFDPKIVRFSDQADTDKERYCRLVIHYVRGTLTDQEDADFALLYRLEAELQDRLDRRDF
jgi:hypothetical protein